MQIIIRYLVFLIIVLTIGSCKKKDEVEPLPVYDNRVVPYKILDIKFTVHSRTNLFNKNIAVQSFTMPSRTLYWTYWVGVGDEPLNELAKVAIPAALSQITKDPFIAYGLKGISVLNAINTQTGNVDIAFMTEDNYNKSLNNEGYSLLPFFQNNGVKSIYGIRETMETPSTYQQNLFMRFTNNNIISAEDVNLKVWAYVIKD